MSKDPILSENRLINWPDFSFYKVSFGYFFMPDESRRLVMIDETTSHKALATSIGLLPTRWAGVWLGANDKFRLPKDFLRVWNRSKIIQIDPLEHAQAFKKTLMLKQHSRLSKMKGAKRFSWHPTNVAPAAIAIKSMFGGVDEPVTPKVEIGSLLNRVEFLGYNHIGQKVFEGSSADSRGRALRFIRSDTNLIASEKDGDHASPAFLRSSSDEDLTLCASGLIGEIASGHTLTSEDFTRYINAIFGENSEHDTALVPKMQLALDRASIRAMSGTSIDNDGFKKALRLHEGRPSYWRETGTLPTPLPIAAILQSIVYDHIYQDGNKSINAADIGSEDKKILDIHPTGSIGHTWGLPSTHCTPLNLQTHDALIGGVYSETINPINISGISVTRSDHRAILESLLLRADDGLSAFIIVGGKNAGKLDPEIKRVLSSVGSKYEIQGLVDLSPQMIGGGNLVNSRILVVGKKRDSVVSGYTIASDVPVYFDYDSLWAWSDTVRVNKGEDFNFTLTTGDDNRWQAPYVPFSHVSEREAMTPRNLLSPVRKALSKLIDIHGMGIDEFVASKLNITVDRLGQLVSAEQVDAAALAIQSIDEGKGFVLADQTGLGKGRTLAIVATYVKVIGKNVIFLTEKAQLFRDFYRDIEDVGSSDLFKTPLVLNSIKADQRISDKDGNVVIKGARPEELKKALSSPEFPSGYDSIWSTYSQFNKKGASPSQIDAHYSASLAIKMIKNGESIDEVIQVAAVQLGLKQICNPEYQGLDEDSCIQRIETNLLSGKIDSILFDSLIVQVKLRDSIKNDPLLKLEKKLESFILKPMAAKLALFNSTLALSNSVVFLDEAHVASGPSSQTSKNLQAAIDQSSSVMYSSATFAKDTQNFGIFRRIFPDTVKTDQLGDILGKGGEPLQEILCAMLAEDGRMIRREHDLSNVEFKNTLTDMPELAESYKARNIQWATSFAQVLSAMTLLSGEIELIANDMSIDAQKKLEAALSASNIYNPSQQVKSTKKMGVESTNFSSQFYNLSRSFMMAVSADICADVAIKALKEGRKPVITVENTMDSTLRAMVEDVLDLGTSAEDEVIENDKDEKDDEELAIDLDVGLPSYDPLSVIQSSMTFPSLLSTDPIDSVPSSVKSKPNQTTIFNRRLSYKDVLNRYADKLFSAKEYERDGRKIIKSTSITIDTPEMKTALGVIRALIDSMPEIPLAPIDLVTDKIIASGYSVGEISRREFSLAEDENGNHVINRLPKRDFSSTIDAFNNGGVDAVILSKAGSTGISLHSNYKFQDISQRELIELQPAADIAQRLQFWGRVNRKGQVVPPHIRFLSTGLAGEKRLQAMQNGKLRKLSANTSGSADNSAIDEEVPDIINRVGNEVCLRLLESNPQLADDLGINMDQYTEADRVIYGTKFVNKLTNNISMLTPDRQEKVYDQLFSEFQSLISQYEIEGRNPLKSGKLDINAERGMSIPVEVQAGGDDSAFNRPVTATELHYRVQLPALNKLTILEEIEDSRLRLTNEYGHQFDYEIKAMVEQEAANVLPSLVSKNFESLEAALGSNTANRAKNFNNSTEWLAISISSFTPGKIFQIVAEGTSGDMDTCVVVDLIVPEVRKCSLSEYIVKVRSNFNRNIHSYPLSVIQNLGSRVQSKPRFFGSEDWFDRWLAPLYDSKDYKAKCVILDGNLFGAARLSDSISSGQAITYSDNQKRPVWHHAIVMPRGFTLKDAANLPVQITNSAMALSVIEEHPNVTIKFSHTWSKKDQDYEITHVNGKYYLEAYNWEKMSWIKTPEILDCLNQGQINGSRGIKSGLILNDKVDDFFTRFIALASENRIKFMLPGNYRCWVSSYNEKLISSISKGASSEDFMNETINNVKTNLLDEMSSMF